MFAISRVVTIVILLALLVILLLVVKSIFFNPFMFDQDPALVQCALQVRTSATVSGLSSGATATNIRCPTQENSVPPGTSDEETKQALAEEMVSCYELWGGGENLLFREDGKYCHVCSVTSFAQKTDLEGFGDYLVTEGRNSKTYMELLAPGFDGETFKGAGDELTTYTVDRQEQYAAIFIHIRGEEQLELFNKQVFSKDALERPVAGAFTAIVIGRFVWGGLQFASCFTFVGAFRCVIKGGGAAVFGGSAGAVVQWLVDDPPEYASFVVLRPLNDESVGALNCQYSFAESR